jgi:hypothetical protein
MLPCGGLSRLCLWVRACLVAFSASALAVAAEGLLQFDVTHAPRPEPLLLKGLRFRTPSACPFPARNSPYLNSPSSDTGSNMRDAGGLQPWG